METDLLVLQILPLIQAASGSSAVIDVAPLRLGGGCRGRKCTGS